MNNDTKDNSSFDALIKDALKSGKKEDIYKENNSLNDIYEAILSKESNIKEYAKNILDNEIDRLYKAKFENDFDKLDKKIEYINGEYIKKNTSYSIITLAIAICGLILGVTKCSINSFYEEKYNLTKEYFDKTINEEKIKNKEIIDNMYKYIDRSFETNNKQIKSQSSNSQPTSQKLPH